MNEYFICLTLAGLAVLGSAILPRLLESRPVSLPILYLALGWVAFSMPLGLPSPHPLKYPRLTEHLAELTVIISLMGAGLKLDRAPGWKRWRTTWRLLSWTMLLTIAATAFLGWWIIGLSVAGALLLGAAMAPTDPVLASEVQVGEPMGEPNQKGNSPAAQSDPQEERSEVRFALTSEAGLNDGLAFPFTNLAILIAAAGVAPAGWLQEWVLMDVLYKIVIGVAFGWVLGRMLGWFIFNSALGRNLLLREMEGSVALAATLLVYALTQLVDGYGFIAVFVAAVTVRDRERVHAYHQVMHSFVETVETILMAIILVLFGGAIAHGLLDPLTWPAALMGAAVLLVIRPLAGYVGLAGLRMPRHEKAAIAFFGIRGLGSMYYLSHALNKGRFQEGEILWAAGGFIIFLSVALHGITAAPIMKWVEDRAGAKS